MDQIDHCRIRGLVPGVDTLGAVAIFRSVCEQVLPSDRSDCIAAELNTASPGRVGRLLEEADAVCRNKLVVFGECLDFGNEMNWHQDPTSGKIWPSICSLDIPLFDTRGCSDIKVPWELSRMHQLVTLGQAYFLSREERYAAKIDALVRDWLRQNPVGVGVNWVCPMEAAIRSINLIWACGPLTTVWQGQPSTAPMLLNLLHSHALYVYQNLENRKRLRDNHYLANLLGLLYVSFFCPFFKASEEWGQFALRELAKEFHMQVLPDGVSYESSTAYHRLAMEILALAFHLATRAVVSPSPIQQGGTVRGKMRSFAEGPPGILLRRMAAFMATYTRPDGQAPQIGDNDNGRILPFDRADLGLNDHRHLLTVAGVLLGEPSLVAAGYPHIQDAAWLHCGGNAKPSMPGPEPHSSAFKSGGYYFLRNAGEYCAIHCAAVGTGGRGNHTHNDNLSLELCCGGEPFIVDPGTYSYSRSPELRNRLRSSSSHNTVLIDSRDQNHLDANQPFALQMASHSRCTEWNCGEAYDMWSGETEWFLDSGGSIRHRRRVRLCKDTHAFELIDEIDGHGEHVAEWYFHLAPSVSVSTCRQCEVVLASARNRVRLRFEPAEGGTLSVRDDIYSPAYGRLVAAAVLHFRRSGSLPIRMRITFARL